MNRREAKRRVIEHMYWLLVYDRESWSAFWMFEDGKEDGGKPLSAESVERLEQAAAELLNELDRRAGYP